MLHTQYGLKASDEESLRRCGIETLADLARADLRALGFTIGARARLRPAMYAWRRLKTRHLLQL
jgi:predicted RecB family nuclease